LNFELEDLMTGGFTTVLHVACTRGHLRIVREMVLKGANVLKEDSLRRLPHHLACLKGHLDIVDFLLSQDVNIHATTLQGWSALHVAAYQG